MCFNLCRFLHLVLLAFNTFAVQSLSVMHGDSGKNSVFAKKENARAVIIVTSQVIRIYGIVDWLSNFYPLIFFLSIVIYEWLGGPFDSNHNTVFAKSHKLDFPLFWWHMYLKDRWAIGAFDGIDSFFIIDFSVHVNATLEWESLDLPYVMLTLLIIQWSLTNVILQKTLPVTVVVVEQLGGALGESGLLVLPCIAAHIIQVSRQYYPNSEFTCANSLIKSNN